MLPAVLFNLYGCRYIGLRYRLNKDKIGEMQRLADLNQITYEI